MIRKRGRGENNTSRRHRGGGCTASCRDGTATKSQGPHNADPECCPNGVPVRFPIMRARQCLFYLVLDYDPLTKCQKYNGEQIKECINEKGTSS
ncbi:hypothetical protein NDU88_007911 [Pleurodeles waltl]|uniref:Uncharacterized protein n=1 Tax=Pleurodeles waltl TaxID=8319 RepID=A0AAV7NW98_PLEWA|nr:hypothetical protein NDU88_007911 [Pleurodeles waltl]